MISAYDIDFTLPSYYDLNKNKFPKVVIGNQNNNNPKHQYLMTDFERSFISRVVAKLPKNSIYLEIGSFVGWNLINVSLTNPLIKVISIDMYDLPHFNNIDPDHVYKVAMTNLKEHDCLFDIQLIKGSSKQMINILPNNSIDCAFIDGDHSYDGCLNDIIEVWPKLKSNGILFGHDGRCVEVSKAVSYIYTHQQIKCPWGYQSFVFNEKILDISQELKINTIDNGLWYSIKT